MVKEEYLNKLLTIYSRKVVSSKNEFIKNIYTELLNKDWYKSLVNVQNPIFENPFISAKKYEIGPDELLPMNNKDKIELIKKSTSLAGLCRSVYNECYYTTSIVDARGSYSKSLYYNIFNEMDKYLGVESIGEFIIENSKDDFDKLFEESIHDFILKNKGDQSSWISSAEEYNKFIYEYLYANEWTRSLREVKEIIPTRILENWLANEIIDSDLLYENLDLVEEAYEEVEDSALFDYMRNILKKYKVEFDSSKDAYINNIYKELLSLEWKKIDSDNEPYLTIYEEEQVLRNLTNDEKLEVIKNSTTLKSLLMQIKHEKFSKIVTEPKSMYFYRSMLDAALTYGPENEYLELKSLGYVMYKSEDEEFKSHFLSQKTFSGAEVWIDYHRFINDYASENGLGQYILGSSDGIFKYVDPLHTWLMQHYIDKDYLIKELELSK